MPIKKLMNYLDEQQVRYVTIRHSPAYTAQEIAASAHVPGRELAKTVIVKVDGRLAMVVVPAPRRLDLAKLAEVLGAERVELAGEPDFEATFPGCEVGAMPPFGHLYGMQTYASSELAQDEQIAFNAGSHTELVRMAWADYQRLARPQMVELGQ